MATSTATLEGPETHDAAERAVEKMRESIDQAAHVRDEVIERTKQEPLKALAVALGVGLAMGALLGWTWRRPTTLTN
jgi:ElaB/YqjD/DUF883 family membrane-anchored ribosome-binding protein